MLRNYIRSLRSEIAPVLAKNDSGLREMFTVAGLEELPTECLFFENGIAVQSDVIRAVAVCFAYFNRNDPAGRRTQSDKHQYLLAVAISQDTTPYWRVHSCFHRIYGMPIEGRHEMWLVPPQNTAGQHDKDYVFLREGENLLVKDRGVSAVAVYINTNGLTDVYTEMLQERQKRR